MKKYDYSVSTQKLIPPLPGLGAFVAKVSYIYETSGTNDVPVKNEFGETYGHTPEEAKQKLEEKVRQWTEVNK